MRKLLLMSLMLFAAVNFSACGKKQAENFIVTKEAYNSMGHYMEITDGDIVYIKNCDTGTKVQKKYTNGLINPAIDVSLEYESYFKISDLSDIESFDEFSYTMPNTYSCSLEDGQRFVASLLKEGWEVHSKYSCYQYSDLYLEKNSILSRVIVFRDRIKVFGNVKEKIYDSWTYIIDSKEELMG